MEWVGEREQKDEFTIVFNNPFIMLPIFTGLKKLPSIFAFIMCKTFYYQGGPALQHSIRKINTTKPGCTT